MKKLAPKPGYRAGDLEFTFKRAGYWLRVEAVRPGAWWITASIWIRNGEPTQAAFCHENIVDCHLDAATATDESSPQLWVGGASFNLRPAEYEALREHFLPLGLRHHVPGSAARAQAPAPLDVTRGDGRRVSVTVPESDRVYADEVEGCGGDADLDRTRC